jgi:hypothetical protein
MSRVWGLTQVVVFVAFFKKNSFFVDDELVKN